MTLINSDVDANVVGTTLVAAFRKSDPPVIWKFDLERNHSFALAMQGDEDEYEFGVTSPKGEFHPVARFSERGDANHAFAVVQKALMKKKSGWIRIGLSWIGAVIVLILFLAVMVSGYLLADFLMRNHTLPNLNSTTAPHVMRNGVPLPADQFLKPPPQ